jgi:hypothetical protein
MKTVLDIYISIGFGLSCGEDSLSFSPKAWVIVFQRKLFIL